MNERVMQFRIGMFVIVAGLVLTMLIVWFGESPSLFRDHRYVVVHFEQAPGVSEGIPVRKSGIRIGEVASIRFDDRAGKPDGVLVTLSLESRYKIRSGSVPRITRGLIGDVSIDMQPGEGVKPLETSATPGGAMAYIIEGEVAPDPSNALAAATEAFQNVKGTLEAIEEAARGLTLVTKKADTLEEFLVSFRDMGQKVGHLAGDLNKVVKDNEAELQPAIANLRQAADRFNTTFDPETQASIKQAAKQLAAGSARLDKILADVGPLASDLGSGPDHMPRTNAGQVVSRFNRIAYDVSLLTQPLTDGRGRLNRNGSLQKLLVETELYDNLNRLATGANRVVSLAEKVVANFNRFAERIANDPSAISRGVLQR